MAGRSMLLVLAGLAVRGALGAEADLTAGSSLRSHHSSLRAEMHRMMAGEEDDVDFHLLSRDGQDMSARGQLHASGPSGGTASLEDYIKDSEEGLSASLGPRWSSKSLEEDANQKTGALLRGISGPKALRAIHGMMGALGR